MGWRPRALGIWPIYMERDIPMKHAITCVLAAALFAVGRADAATLTTVDTIDDAARTNFNGFEGLPSSSSYGPTYTEGGITVTQKNGGALGILTTFMPGGVAGTRAWYPNGGDYGYTEITKADGSDFANIGFLRGSGNSQHNYLIYSLLNDGAVIQSGVLSVVSNVRSYVAFMGGGFDTVRVRDGSSPTATVLDGSHNAMAIDSIELGGVATTAAPTPGVAASGLGLMGSLLIARRRKAATA
jgi:hypothetical protein